MKFKKFLLLNIIIALFISTAVVILSETESLQHLQLGSLDLLFRLRGAQPYNPHIVLVEIDDDNISNIGRWPWKRVWHAAMTKALNKLGAKYIYFDIIFSEPAPEEDDNLFSQAIKDAKNVYLPFVFPEGAIDIKNALLPIEKLSSYAKGTGSVNVYPDSDGALRKIPLVFKDKRGELYHNIGLKIGMDYLRLESIQINREHLVLSSFRKKVEIPVIDDNEMLINWRGKWKDTFKHYSFIDVLNAYRDTLEGKKPKIDVGPIKNSICLVAVTAIGLYDIIAVPVEPEYPSIGVVATIINNIIDRQFIKTAPLWVNCFCIYMLALIPSLLISGEKALRETLLAISVGGVFVIVDFLLFIKGSVWLDPSLPLISLFGSYLSVGTYNFIRVSIEKKDFFKLAITDALTRLYNIRYFKIVLKTECIMAKTHPNKQFCVVMTDVDHFKHFNDTYGHQVGDLVLKEIAKVLEISVRTSDIVARYGGEEMIILLRGTSLKHGLDVADKIRKNVENLKITDEKNTYKVTISLGLSKFNSKDNEETIIKRADNALYKAKDSGRNRTETIETT